MNETVTQKLMLFFPKCECEKPIIYHLVKDYNLIVKVADRLPPSVLQEDASLLMYYDNALMRAEAEPEQGRLL